LKAERRKRAADRVAREAASIASLEVAALRPAEALAADVRATLPPATGPEFEVRQSDRTAGAAQCVVVVATEALRLVTPPLGERSDNGNS